MDTSIFTNNGTLPVLIPHCLTTAEIIYHLPDHPLLLQNFIWQDIDIPPEFPVLHRFLDFWNRNLDSKVHSVIVASSQIVKPVEFRFADSMLTLQ
jgi:uncharacterized protein Usg